MGSGYKTDKNRKLRGFYLLTSKTKREMKKLLVNKKLNNNNETQSLHVWGQFRAGM